MNSAWQKKSTNIILMTDWISIIFITLLGTMFMRTLNLQQAANFLGINKETARRRVVTGQIPGAKVGRSWRFIEEDLATYLRSLYANPASQGVSQRRKTAWHSTKEIKSIGLISPTMEQDYNAALGLLTK